MDEHRSGQWSSLALPPSGEELGVKAKSLTVCLVAEGSYPHYPGGVSTWCHMLVQGLPEVRFVLVSLVADPSALPVFELPPNVEALIPVPLWGTGEVLELQRDLGLGQVIKRKRSAPVSIIQSRFLPPFRRFLQLLWGHTAQPALVGQALLEMASYFQEHDYDVTMRSQPVWECFLTESNRGYPQFCHLLGVQETTALLDVTDAMRLLYRWLTVLTIKIPRVDVVHAAASGLASLPGILAGQMQGASFLLTEHGVYLRERLLALTRAQTGLFDQAFQARFTQRLTEAGYFYADQISPGSNYNHRWEVQMGAQRDRIRTIYNGPDPAGFTPTMVQKPDGAPPSVVWLGRIDPLKDLETLIRAAALVHQSMPEARFVLYGKPPAGNEWYYDACVRLRDQLGLKQCVLFAGFAASAEAAYNEGDVVVLSSISEGFPYSVVEAMMCGRPVVGTSVGGVPEALEGCGLVVEPRNAEEMAAACLRLLRDPQLRQELGHKARHTALERFSLQQCNTAYLGAYQRLATVASLRAQSRVEPTPKTAPFGQWHKLRTYLTGASAAKQGH